jgi:hypothetical protein
MNVLYCDLEIASFKGFKEVVAIISANALWFIITIITKHNIK